MKLTIMKYYRYSKHRNLEKISEDKLCIEVEIYISHYHIE